MPDQTSRTNRAGLMSPRAWAGRLGFPLLAVGAVLAIQGVEGEGTDWRYLGLAIPAWFAGLLLIRLRHGRRHGGRRYD